MFGKCVSTPFFNHCGFLVRQLSLWLFFIFPGMVLLSPLKTTMTCFNLSIRNHIIIQTCNVELWCSRKSPMRPLTRPLRTRWKTSRIRNRNYNSSKKVGKKALQNKIEFREIKSRARQFRIRRSSDITVFENSSKKSHYKIQGIFHGFYRYLFT